MQANDPTRYPARTTFDDVVFTIVLSIFAGALVALGAFAITDAPGSAGVAAHRPAPPQRVGALAPGEVGGVPVVRLPTIDVAPPRAPG